MKKGFEYEDYELLDILREEAGRPLIISGRYDKQDKKFFFTIEELEDETEHKDIDKYIYDNQDEVQGPKGVNTIFDNIDF